MPTGNKSPIPSAGVICIAVHGAAAIAGVGLLWLFVVAAAAAVCLAFIGVRFLGRDLATDLGVSKLLAVGAFDLGPCNATIIPAEMAGLLAVSASNIVHVLGLITVLRNVTFLSTVATGSAASIRTILGKVAG
ncbi:hypothetical protein HDV57DRAFT_332315 [Trichoderma longibrachiatum]